MLLNGIAMDTLKTEQAKHVNNEEEKERAAEDSKTDVESSDDERTKEPSTSTSAKNKNSVKAKRITKNNVRKLRMDRMMSKAELARRASLSTLTIDRVEKGMPCRMDTKRKILEALGLTTSDRVTVFGEDD